MWMRPRPVRKLAKEGTGRFTETKAIRLGRVMRWPPPPCSSKLTVCFSFRRGHHHEQYSTYWY